MNALIYSSPPNETYISVKLNQNPRQLILQLFIDHILQSWEAKATQQRVSSVMCNKMEMYILLQH